MKVPTLPARYGVTVVRIMAGIIIVVAALEKYSAGGFTGFTRATAGFGVPGSYAFGIFIPLLELIGGAMVLFGLWSRWVAILFVIEYSVTSFLLKVPAKPPFGGWDSMRIDLMLLATAIGLVLVGPGGLALQSVIGRGYSGSHRPTAQPHPVPAGER